VFAALIHIPANIGYAAVFALVAVETMGIPVPAETALVAAALLAHNGQMSLVTLILVAAAGAIIGDNIGFAIGRRYGRRLFLVSGPFEHHRKRVLEVGEPFFAKHGPKAVFLGRWVAGLRIASAWLAGMNKMPWPTFLFWNALGGICWSISICVAIYLLGEAADKAIGYIGGGALALVVIALAGFFLYRRRQRTAAVDARDTSSGADGE
jgi:membrane-associated protein